jgi:hypothetical protein
MSPHWAVIPELVSITSSIFSTGIGRAVLLRSGSIRSKVANWRGAVLEFNRSSIGTVCPHPRETMACPGGWAKDSDRLIHNVCAMAWVEKIIDAKTTITLRLTLFITTSFNS